MPSILYKGAMKGQPSYLQKQLVFYCKNISTVFQRVTKFL